MARVNPINFLSNRSGIPRIASMGVNVGTTSVSFTFNSDFTFSNNFSGLVLVRLDQSIPEGTTTTLPIIFTSVNGGDQAVTSLGGDAVTVADITGTGVYLMYYDRATSTLQIVA